MLEQMSAQQFREWMWYDSQHPIGDLRTEVEFARLKMTVAGLFVDMKGKSIRDFMWSFFQQRPADQNVSRKLLHFFGLKKDDNGG